MEESGSSKVYTYNAEAVRLKRATRLKDRKENMTFLVDRVKPKKIESKRKRMN